MKVRDIRGQDRTVRMLAPRAVGGRCAGKPESIVSDRQISFYVSAMLLEMRNGSAIKFLFVVSRIETKRKERKGWNGE